MKLLDYEAMEGQEGSYNDMMKQLVEKVRYYYSQVSSDDFSAAIPELRNMEEQILRLDREMGEEERNYLQEIYNELSEQAALGNTLDEDFRRIAKVLFGKYAERDFNAEEFAYGYEIINGISVVEYLGAKEKGTGENDVRIVSEILRALCNKYNIVFFDGSRKF